MDTCAVTTTGVAPATFASALQMLAATQCLITEHWPDDAYVQDGDKFDFIIIGAGSAGSVLANRLSEISDWKILLVEAGKDPPQESIIPLLAAGLVNTQYDWNYTTVNDGRSSQGLRNGVVPTPRGRMLGGSSSMNALIYFQGNAHDYQEWYDEGNEEWHPDIAKEYSKKAESLQDQHLLMNPIISENYGKTGPLVINSFNSTNRALYDRVLEAWDEIGIRNVPDLNSASIMGSGIFRGTAANGKRQSTAEAYLRSIKDRTNLKIMKNSLATKILIDDHNNAYGVVVEKDDEILKLYAKKEVIVSAGAYNSPQILLLSGIGPKEELNSHKIPIKVDLPAVGKNLQDHLWVTVPIYGDKPGEIDQVEQAFNTVKYLYNRTGYLAQSILPDIAAFYSLDKNTTRAQFQIHTTFYFKNDTGISLFTRNYQDSIAKSLQNQSKRHFSYLFLFNLLKPRSRGRVNLKTSDPRDHPNIYSGYFTDTRDLEDAAAGIKMLTKIIDTEYFRSINGFLGRVDWEPCNHLELDSTEYWKCIALNTATTIYHPVGTCKMDKDPNTAVVDSRLRVHGVGQLRVVDASIMPTITACNTNGPTIMIAERAADLIKEDYQNEICN